MKFKKKILMVFSIALPIFAGHPLSTDDSYFLGKGNAQFEFLSEYFINNTEKEIAFPVSLSYGIFDNTDIVVTASYHRGWDEAFSNGGFNDVVIELKQLVYKGNMIIGIKPFITIPTGKEEIGFGKGKVVFGSFFLLTKEWEGLHLHTQFGYTRNNNSVNEKVNLWEYSIAVEKYITEDLSTVFEFGLTKNCCNSAPDLTKFLIGGMIYQLNKSFAFDLGLLKGLDYANSDLGFLFGVTIGF